MNQSLVSDIVKRNIGRGLLRPPGCCLSSVAHPVPTGKYHFSVPIGIVIEHRFAFWLWMRVKHEFMRNFRHDRSIKDNDYQPPDLLTMDWHNDVGGNCDFVEDELRRLNQDDENEVGFLCWAGLSQLNDGHIAPAMWLNVVGNVYVVLKQSRMVELKQRVLIDRYGQEHVITFMREPHCFLKHWQRKNNNNGLLWDIDLDYFTEAKLPPDQCYSRMLTDEAISLLLDPTSEWLQAVLANLRGITIALEPKYTGGISNSLHLFRQWEKSFFAIPLFDRKCCWHEGIIVT